MACERQSIALVWIRARWRTLRALVDRTISSEAIEDRRTSAFAWHSDNVGALCFMIGFRPLRGVLRQKAFRERHERASSECYLCTRSTARIDVPRSPPWNRSLQIT